MKSEPSNEKCLMCDNIVVGYVAVFCCSGFECGCLGMVEEPAICSDECWDSLMSGKRNKTEEENLD